MEVYRHSGKMPLAGIPLTIVFGAATAAVLGVIYSYIIVYDPIIYINMMCAAGLRLLHRHVRGQRDPHRQDSQSRAGRRSMDWYLAWPACTSLGLPITGRGSPSIQPHSNRSFCKNYIAWFYETRHCGRWAITATRAKPSKASSWGAIWVVEAAVIVGLCRRSGTYRSVTSLPFCELCNEWTKANLGGGLVEVQPGHPARLSHRRPGRGPG